jgi:hypothetical protein
MIRHDSVSLREYFEALRAADQRALQIKETADERALLLQAETQQYKDEKANNLRTQIEGERGMYATKDEVATLREAVIAFTAAQASRSAAALDWRTGLIALLAIAVAVIVKFA